jgi:TRAP-type mannitol/chloroaromatic compound transport system permease small subunit
MPSLTFELPHWLYWSGLILFPLIAMFLVRRRLAEGDRARTASLPLAYLLWLCGGFAGLHRFYVRNWHGVVHMALFVGVLYANVVGREARNAVSKARNDLLGAEFDVERFQEALADGVEGAAEKVAAAEQALVTVRDQLAAVSASFEQWTDIAGGIALAIALLLLLDAVLLPRMVRRCAEREAREARAERDVAPIQVVAPPGLAPEDPTLSVHTRFTDKIDAISGWTGEFVAYWSLIAVFVYYFEVIARYVFNSPTNWAHESMFLMFGMQYLISGAYALREDSHVRVDVIYMHLPTRAKVVTDIVTSIFFFIFTGTLLVTGWIFMMDSIDVMEVSFTEWAIQYWPVKVAITLGALLLILQGVSKLLKDFALLLGKGV